MSAENPLKKTEKLPPLWAKITFSRHEETHYTGVGRDITERGIARAQDKGKRIVGEKGMPAVVGHSPRERAKGTAESIVEGVERVGDAADVRWIEVPNLRPTDFYDQEFVQQMAQKLGVGPGEEVQKAWSKTHHKDSEFYDNPDKLETNEDKRARMYRELERLTSFMEKRDVKGEAPHLVFVSHYELLTLLLDDVFGITTFGTTNVPTFGEHIDIDMYQPLPSGDVPLRIHYAGHEKLVYFVRKLRRLVAPPK